MPQPATPTDSARSLSEARAYSVPELAKVLHVGTRPIYRAIRDKRLRAAVLNDRGDLRVLGTWALAYLESCAASPQA